MLLGLAIHVVVFASVSTLCVAVWALTSGSFAEAVDIITNPDLWSRSEGASFWPIWVIVPWGVFVTLHAGVAFALLLLGGRRRRERRRLRKAKLEAELSQLRRKAELDVREPEPAQGPVRQPRRRWVSVLFVDIVGSTSLNAELGDERWSRVLADYRELVRTRAAARGGDEVGTQGDGLLIRFATPAEAVLCGVDIQSDLDHISDGLSLRVRIGIHAGEAVENDGDLIGKVINLAARVTDEARPGEILVTEPVADYLGNRLHVEDRGLHPLKGIEQPRHLLAIVWSDTGARDVSVGPADT